jgi:hypothetical protein
METKNKCYSLTVREQHLADLAVAGLSSYLREKLEGQEFTDVNQVMQRAMAQENRARDNRQAVDLGTTVRRRMEVALG